MASDINRTKAIKDFEDITDLDTQQYLLGIKNAELGSGGKVTFADLLQSSLSSDSGNKISLGSDLKLFGETALTVYSATKTYAYQEWVLDNQKIFSSTMNGNIGHPTSDTDYWTEVELGGGGGSGMPIGTIYSVVCTEDYVPSGAMPCDGSEYTKAQFTDFYNNYLNADTPLLKTCSYTDWNSAVTTYGQCPMFAIDTTNNKFKAPLIKDGSYITQALSDTELGKSYNESLPNIKGSITIYTSYGGVNEADGAFNVTNGGGTGESYQYADNRPKFNLDASSSSSTYQDDAKVQGDNVRARYFVQVATGSINQSEMDWAQYMAGLQAKVDKSSLQDCQVVIETYVNGTSGYRIWSDGYCEQWGYSATSKVEIFLMKNYSDTNYNIQYSGQMLGSDYWSNYPIITQKNNNSFYLGAEDTSRSFYWKTSGYLADGEY